MFMFLSLMVSSIIHFEFSFIQYQLIIESLFAYRHYIFFSAPFVKRTILFTLNVLGTFVKNHLAIHRVNLWTCYSVPLFFVVVVCF